MRAVESVRNQTRRPLEDIRRDRRQRRARAPRAGRARRRDRAANAHAPDSPAGRHTGADHARGAILAFLDDDAIADADWLEQLDAAYEDPQGARCRWSGRAPVGDRTPRLVPARVQLGRRLHLLGICRREGRIRSPIGATCRCAPSCSGVQARSNRELAGRARKDVLRHRRGDRVLHPRPRTEPGRYWLYRPRARVRHAVPRAARHVGATSCAAAGSRATRRGTCRHRRSGDGCRSNASMRAPSCRAQCAGARRGGPAPSTLARARLGDSRRADLLRHDRVHARGVPLALRGASVDRTRACTRSRTGSRRCLSPEST